MNKKIKLFLLILVITVFTGITACNKKQLLEDNSSVNVQETEQQEPSNKISNKEENNVLVKIDEKKLNEIFDDKTNYEKTRNIFNKYEFVKSDFNPIDKPKEYYEQFCNEFLEDFKTDKNIKLIEPKVVTNDYDSDELSVYFKKCPIFVKPPCFSPSLK